MLGAGHGFVRIGLPAPFGILALFAGLRDPLAEPLTTLVVASAAVLVAIYAMRWLLRLASPSPRIAPAAEMPAWGRRRFLGTSIAVIGLAVVGGVAGGRCWSAAERNAIAAGRRDSGSDGHRPAAAEGADARRRPDSRRS